MKQHVNGYGGLDKDSSYESIPNNKYINANDIRITTSNGESNGSFTNIKGNTLYFTIPQIGIGVSEIIGYTTIRNTIVLFIADDSNTNGWLYTVKYNDATQELMSGSPNMIYYSDALNFSKSKPIEAIGRFESSSIQRIYWTDYDEYIRSVNIQDPDLLTTEVGNIDIFPNVTYTFPRLQTIQTGGVFPVGEYQVTYRVRTVDGKETLIAPPSAMIHMTTSAENGTTSNEYIGAEKTLIANKALNIQIDTTDYVGKFKEIDVFLIFHETLEGLPTIKFIETKEITSANTNFLILNTENTIRDIEYLEYTSKVYAFQTCKTLTQKDGSLVVANIKSSSFSIQELLAPGETFDASTYRSRLVSPGIYETSTDVFNQEYNRDAHWDADWHNTKQFKYRASDGRLGGEGLNVKYNFHLEPYTMDGSIDEGIIKVADVPNGFPYDNHDLNDGYTNHNTSYPNMASPFLSGRLRGFKRGETYRIGLVGFNLKGETSFVEFIGDIKFPDISDIDTVDTINVPGVKNFPTARSVNGIHTIGYSLGLEFTLDFSSCPSVLDKITSYQIVRCKRELKDKRRIASGIVKNFYFARTITPEGGVSFNLIPPAPSGDNLFHLMPYAATVADGSITRESGTFTVLAQETGLKTDMQYASYLLGFYSPEISHGFQDVIATGGNLQNKPLLLTTGYCEEKAFTSVSDNSGAVGNELGEYLLDYRKTVKNIFGYTTAGDIERVKKLVNSQYTKMAHDSSSANAISFGLRTLRNWYAMFDHSAVGAHLNYPSPAANDTISQFSKGGTSLILETSKITNDPINNNTLGSISATDYFRNVDTDKNTSREFPIMDLMIPKSEIYGGFDQSILESNVFIPMSPVIKNSFLNPKVFGGDVFINMFAFQTGTVELDSTFYDNNDEYSINISRSEAIPVESAINSDIDRGSTLSRGVEYTYSTYPALAVLRQELNNSFGPYGTSSFMFAYNTVFSKEASDVTYFIKPNSNIFNETVNDIRAYLSNVKINGEIIDSWTKFGVNNYYDVDDYGPINKILNFNDNIYFIQDKALGVYAINPRAITTTSDGVPTQLGSGEGFGKHTYITKENGSIHQWGIKATSSGIFFFDAIHKKMFLVGQGTTPISEIKGIHSWLQTLPNAVFLRKENGGDNPILKKGITIGKDLINDELIFVFLGSGNFVNLETDTQYLTGTIVFIDSEYYVVLNTFTSTSPLAQAKIELLANSRMLDKSDKLFDTSIVYDELVQQFSSHYSQTPSIYIENGDILLSPNPLLPKNIYQHNKGNWGQFYGITKESSITLIINPESDFNKVLRTFEFNSVVRTDDKTIDRTQTITAFRIQTEYQDTAKIPFSVNRIKRKFDKWRVKIPRNQISTLKRDRLRESYFILTLYFDNTYNKEIIVNRLISHYDVQMF